MFQQIVDWAEKPFDPNMSVTGWFLIVGLILLSLFVWSRVVRLIGA